MKYISINSSNLTQLRSYVKVAFVALAMLGILLSVGTASAADPPIFLKEPILDLRPVSVVITKDDDGQFELVIGNPSLNDPDMAGEVVMHVPPGMTIYGSILGGSGGTGMVQIPFVRDPIKPGSTRTTTLWVRSQIEGAKRVTASITVWPVGNKNDNTTRKLHYDAEVREISTSTTDPTSDSASGADGSGSCLMGSKPELGLAFVIFMIPAFTYVRGRKHNK